MNAVHLAALLVRAAKLPAPSLEDGDGRNMYNGFVTDVLQAVIFVLPACGSREVCSIAWAAARLKAMPVDGLNSQSPLPRSQLADPRSSSAPCPPPDSEEQRSSRPLAVMQYTGFIERQSSTGIALAVTCEWWAALLLRCHDLLPHCNGQDLSMVLWAVVQVQQHIELPLQQLPLRARPARVDTDVGDPGAGTCASGHARVKLQTWQRILPSGFIARILQTSEAGMETYGPQALSGLVWALAKLRVVPSLEWQDVFLQCSAAQLPNSAPQAIANTAWALTVFEAAPPSAWFTAFLKSSLDCAARAPPASVAQVLWSAARLPHFRPPPRWVAGVCSAVDADQLAQYSSQDLANMLWAVSALNYQPPADWVQAAVAALARTASSAPALEVAAGLSALARLGYHPGSQIVLGLADHVVKSRQAGAQEVCNTLWALATFRTRPAPALVKSALETVYQRLEDIGPQELAQLWWSLGVLRAAPPAGLAAMLHNELLMQKEAMQAQEIAMVLLGYARLGLHVEKELLDILTSQVLRGIKAVSSQHPAQPNAALKTGSLALVALATMVRHTRGAEGRSQGSFVQALLSLFARQGPAAERPCEQSDQKLRASELRVSSVSTHMPLPGWTQRDLATVVSALADLRQPIAVAWADQARRLLIASHKEPLSKRRSAVLEVLRLTCGLCALHTRVTRLRRTESCVREAAAPTGLTLSTWARALAPWFRDVDRGTLQKLRPSQIAQLCRATARLVVHTSTRARDEGAHKQMMAAHSTLVATAVQAAASGQLSLQDTAAVMASIARVCRWDHKSDFRQAARDLLLCQFVPAQDPVLSVHCWCMILCAAAGMKVPVEEAWVSAACQGIQAGLLAVLGRAQLAGPQPPQGPGVGSFVRSLGIAISGLQALQSVTGASQLQAQIAHTLSLLQQARVEARDRRAQRQLRRVLNVLAQ